MAKFQTRNSTGLQNSNPGICRTPELRTRNPPESGIPRLSYPEFRWTPAGIQTGPGIPLEFRRNSGPIFTRVSIKPLCVHDVSKEKGRSLIPDSLYSFLSEVISRQEKKGPTTESDGFAIGAEKERRTVMLGQDIIHAASNSRVKTRLAVTIHHLTGSKEVVTVKQNGALLFV